MPVRVRNWRQEARPGYLEVDLVSHSGRWAIGEWIYTLSATDLETGWSELVPVMTKSQREVVAGFARLHRQLPFPLFGMHIDNGVEFLNQALIDYCRRHQVQLSRGRPFHGNDNPHIEQKNGYLYLYDRDAIATGYRQRKADFDVGVNLHRIFGSKQNPRARDVLSLPLVPLGIPDPPVAHGKMKGKSRGPHVRYGNEATTW